MAKDEVQLGFYPIKAIFQSLDPSALPPVIGLEFLPEISHQQTRQLKQDLMLHFIKKDLLSSRHSWTTRAAGASLGVCFLIPCSKRRGLRSV